MNAFGGPGPARSRPPVVQTLVIVGLVAIAGGRLGGIVGGTISALGTAAHEAGHALFADLLTGDVLSVTVFPDGGGVTFSEASGSSWRTFLVAGAGYPATLFVALALLSAVFFAVSSRPTAAAAAAVTTVVWMFWTPFNAAVPAVTDGEQRFTWFVLGVTAVALAGFAALPDRFDYPRRIALGVLAAGLLTDAFGAGRDLTVIEGIGGVATDADALAETAGVLSSSTWAWLMRGALFVIAGLWAWWAIAHATPDDRGVDLT